MKKNIFTKIAAFAVAAVAFISLASCSNVNQGYVDKINNAGDNKITYDQAVSDLGNEVLSKKSLVGVGYIVACNKTQDQLKEIAKKMEEDTEGTYDERIDKYTSDMKFIFIEVAGGNCQSAQYCDYKTIVSVCSRLGIDLLDA